MTREQRILDFIRNSSEDIDTLTVAQALDLDRSNVSRILNQLVEQGMIRKIAGKPVLYRYQTDQSKKKDIELFEESNPSLKGQIDQAKSSILYPPNGINALIVGETGVGKSHFAQMMFQFAQEMSILKQDAPFILFNCADYAKNPELLMGMLFGVKKGAYTGADHDKAGLIEQADQGILFLDEIHNLPQQGQEILFTFIDQGVYRRLGESSGHRKAAVRIIGATSESIISTLVQPFRRRMPMLIEMPNLAHRLESERADLIQLFFNQEAKTLDQKIYISNDVFISLLFYHCPNNIGQLKSDIQLLCAKAYSDYLLQRKKNIQIEATDLPPAIADGLLDTTEHRTLRVKSDYFSMQKLCFKPTDGEQEQDHSIYSLLENKVSGLGEEYLGTEKMKKIVEQEIDNYFSTITHGTSGVNIAPLESIIDENRFKTIKKVVDLVHEELQVKWDKNIEMGFILHLHHLIEGAKNGQYSGHFDEEINIDYQLHHRKEFLLAVRCIQLISFEEKVQLPYEESNNLVSFFINASEQKAEKKKVVQILVIAHGDSTATSMANTVNQLLNVQAVIAFDASLNKNPSVVIEEIKRYLQNHNSGEDILCLVDMGSFMHICHDLQKLLHVKVLALPLVSTLHVLEATRKSILGEDVQNIYNALLSVNFEFFGCHENDDRDGRLPSKNERIVNINKPIALLTCCLTGHGTAKYLKQIIEKSLLPIFPELAVIPLQMERDQLNQNELKRLSEQYELLAIVSTFKVDSSLKQYTVSDIVNGSGIEEIREQINESLIGNQIKQSLGNELKHVDGAMLFGDLLSINQSIEETLKVQLTKNELIGVIMHTAILIDHLKQGERYPNKSQQYVNSYQKELAELHTCFYPLEKKLSIHLSDRELFPILEYYLHLR
ncbi:sigma 54-interacting transcriptional regulator [Enterococcus sp.]|uniref:sigma 54-interacting transcriptional regulator n=1 Tax=Enterococcus sp. TaxID=35783 RepID=UPI0028967554|nr:sigma 54-interacting transcriptional regulator [Enterococcus sp.]